MALARGEPAPAVGALRPLQRARRRLTFDHVFPILLCAPATLVLVALTLYPTLFSVNASLRDVNIYNFRSGAHRFVGLSNYMRLLTSQDFWDAAVATATYVVASTLLVFVIALGLALLFERADRLRAVVSPLLLIPLMATPAVVALCWSQLLISDIGVVNYLLGLVGVEGPAWLGKSPWPMVSVVFIDVWEHVPFMYFVLLAGLTVLPHEPFEAAAIDGAGGWQTFRYLTLPLLKPVILVALIFRIMTALTTFDIIYVLTGGSPGSGTETLNLLLFRLALKAFEVGQSGALAVVMVLITAVIAACLMRAMYREESL